MVSITPLIIGLILLSNVNCIITDWATTFLITNGEGDYCHLVYTSPANIQPKIRIGLQNGTEPIEFAVLIIRNSEMKQVDFPYGQDFRAMFPSNTSSLVCQEGEEGCEVGLFKLPNPPSPHSKLGRVASGSLDTLEYDVTEQGVYCIYIQANDTSRAYPVPVVIGQSYGYLPFEVYTHLATYTTGNSIYFLVLALFAVYLIVTGRGFRKLSVLSHSVLFYILLPYFILNVSRQVGLEIINSKKFEGMHPANKLEGTIKTLLIVFRFGVAWFVLIFMNGYGVIYNRLSEIQFSNRVKSYVLLFWAVVSVIYFEWQEHHSKIASYIWWGVFIAASGYSYRNTRQSLRELKRDDLARRYHWTILVMILIIIFDIFSHRAITKLIDNCYNWDKKGLSRDEQIDARDSTQRYTREFYRPQIKFADYLIATIFFFFIWIKDNKVLVDEEVEGLFRDAVEEEQGGRKQQQRTQGHYEERDELYNEDAVSLDELL